MDTSVAELSALSIGILISVLIQQVDFNQLWSPFTLSKVVSSQNGGFSTSGWCTGDSEDTRTCRFQNLCYHPKEGKLVLILSENSTFIGLTAVHSK